MKEVRRMSCQGHGARADRGVLARVRLTIHCCMAMVSASGFFTLNAISRWFS
jgi:hypothetical protein